MEGNGEHEKKLPPVEVDGNVLTPRESSWQGPLLTRKDPLRHPEKVQAANMVAERLTKKAQGAIAFGFNDLISFEPPDIAHFERVMFSAIDDLTEEDLDLAHELRLVIRAKMNGEHPVMQVGQYHGTFFKADPIEPEIVVDVEGRVADDIRAAMLRIRAS